MSRRRRPAIGDRLPDLVRNIELADLVAYGAATWDWHRLHYDVAHAKGAGLDQPVVDGQMFGALLAEQVSRFVGPGGRITRLHFRNRAPVHPGSTLTCVATVVDADDVGFRLDQTITVDGRVVVAPAGAEVVYR